jgi:transcription antitermination factor NusG
MLAVPTGTDPGKASSYARNARSLNVNVTEQQPTVFLLNGGSNMTTEKARESQFEPWLVLRTRSHHENIVESSLQQKQINVYLPRQRVVRRRKDRRTILEMPLFPGYVFVQPREDQFENIRYVRGSCGFVVRGDRPAPMPQKELEAVRILANSGAELAVNPKLIPGQRVEVISGPFMGVQGELVRVKSQDRLVINAYLVSSSVSVEVDSDKVAIL